jgi:hypothetical protein
MHHLEPRMDEDTAVAEWRFDQLLTAGVDPALAACLAADPRWDLHALIDLIERGCRPDLAARILMPDEAEDACDR